MTVSHGMPHGRRVRRARRIAAFTPLLVFLVPALLTATEPVSRDTLLRQYCFQCHNSRVKSGGLALDSIPVSDPSARPDVWEKVLRKLKAGEMPPPKLPRPDAATVEAFTSGLISELDMAARRNPYSGRSPIRRLN